MPLYDRHQETYQALPVQLAPPPPYSPAPYDNGGPPGRLSDYLRSRLYERNDYESLPPPYHQPLSQGPYGEQEFEHSLPESFHVERARRMANGRQETCLSRTSQQHPRMLDEQQRREVSTELTRQATSLGLHGDAGRTWVREKLDELARTGQLPATEDLRPRYMPPQMPGRHGEFPVEPGSGHMDLLDRRMH